MESDLAAVPQVGDPQVEKKEPEVIAIESIPDKTHPFLQSF